MTPQTIQQGAEAIIYKINNKVVKERIPKSYRLKELDNKLRKKRTKSEAKIINKLQGIIPVPELLADPGMGRMIHMQYINGKKLSEHLESLDYKQICKQIAQTISKLHNQDIIHGDLTTSNMIYVKNNKTNKTPSSHPNLLINNSNKGEQEGKVYLIDFGLSFHSHKIEDKAVDLHLIQQALNAKHFKIANQAIKIILNNYKPLRYKEILEKLKVVESRGRYKERG